MGALQWSRATCGEGTYRSGNCGRVLDVARGLDIEGLWARPLDAAASAWSAGTCGGGGIRRKTMCVDLPLCGSDPSLSAGSFEMWYRRHYAREYAREKWELENYAKGEKEEMVGLFSFKGLNRDDAKTVVETMSASKDFFVGLMMTEELQLREPLARCEARAAIASSCYALAALVPLFTAKLLADRGAGWCVDPLCQSGDDAQFVLLLAIGIGILGVLGARRAANAMLPWHTHTVESICLGIATALSPKLISWVVC